MLRYEVATGTDDFARREAVGEFREVEDAVRSISSPLLQSFKAQLVDVLRVNYEVLDSDE